MFKTTRGFVIGFVSACVLTTSITAFAAPVEKKISILYNDIKIFVDGKSVDLKDAKGNNIEPFIYNGTTYLPVRAVGEAFNSNVKFDGKKNEIYIGSTNENKYSVDLSALDYLNETHTLAWGGYPASDHSGREGSSISVWGEADKDNTGVNYQNGLMFNLQGDGAGKTSHVLESSREYLLNQKYKRFQGNFVLNYNDRSNIHAHAVLKVYGDDKLLFTSDNLEASVLPMKFDIDTTGVIKLKIVVTNTDQSMDLYDSVHVGIVNSGFIK